MKLSRYSILACLIVLVLAGAVSASELAGDDVRLTLILQPYAEVAIAGNLELKASVPEGGEANTSFEIRTTTRLNVEIASRGMGTVSTDFDVIDPFVTYTVTAGEAVTSFTAGQKSNFVTPLGGEGGKYGNGYYTYGLRAVFNAEGLEWWSFPSDLHYFDRISVTVSKAS